MTLLRALVLSSVVALQALWSGGAVAQAEDWPQRPVRLVIGVPPGSGSDLLARALSERLAARWKQQVLVENRPGANTVLSAAAVAQAAPDGHTLLFGIDSTFSILPHLNAKLPYDPVRDFEPITLLTSFGMVLVATPSLQARSVPQLVERAKAAGPGHIAYASQGPGSHMHLLMEMLNLKAGIQLNHVPYKGIPQMSMALSSGEIPLTWLGVYTARSLIADGKVVPLAYSGEKRTSLMPGLPTMTELGYPDVTASAWYGLLAPRGTPKPIIDKIHADVSAVLADPAFAKEQMLAKAYEPADLKPEQFRALIRQELQSRQQMVKVSGAKME
jgi:tripartite-type tricarboxylate transporter receptor subunit TctC